MRKRSMCIGLILLLIFCLTQPRAYASTSPSEEKIICTATLENNFSGGSVLILLTNEASLQLKEYTPADFPEISCVSVRDLTAPTWEIVKIKLAGGDASQMGMDDLEKAQSIMDNIKLDTYKRTFQLNLKEQSKEAVLEAIRLLEVRDDVYCAEPNYIMELASCAPEKTPSNQETVSDSIVPYILAACGAALCCGGYFFLRFRKRVNNEV